MKKKVVKSILRERARILRTVVKLYLTDISNDLYSKELIPQAIYDRVVEGVTGRDNAQLAAEVVSAVEKKLQISPDCWQEVISILGDFAPKLAEELEQKYQGKDTYMYIQENDIVNE